MDIVERLREGFPTNYELDAADEIERLRKQSRINWDAFQKAADEIKRLRNNAKQDAQYLLAYHRICQKHGIAPSSSELIAALGEKE